MEVSRVLLESPPRDVTGSKKKEERLCIEKSPFSFSAKCLSEMSCDCITSEIVETVCIRYDFDKTIQVPSTPKSLFTEATPLFSYMERTKKESKANFNNNLNELLGTTNRNILHKQNGSLKGESSPESRKRELYSYLQLMDPADRKKRPKVSCRTLRTRKINTNVGDNSKVSSTPSLCEDVENKYMPLPAKEIYNNQVHFDDAIQHFVCDWVRSGKETSTKVVKKRRKIKFDFQSRINLRSRRRSKHVSLDRLIIRSNHIRKKVRKKLIKDRKKSLIDQSEQALNVQTNFDCDSPTKIISHQSDVPINVISENIDLKNFVDDMLELDKMSETHKKAVIETRILSSNTITNFIANSTKQEEIVQKALKIFTDLSSEHIHKVNEENSIEKTEATPQENEPVEETLVQGDGEINNSERFGVDIEEEEGSSDSIKDLVILDHDYTSVKSSSGETEDELEDDLYSRVSLSPMPHLDIQVLPVKPVTEMKSLHKSLAVNPRRKRMSNSCLQDWDSKMEHNNLKHSIEINSGNGKVLRAFYQECNLVVVQQISVSFWTQSALGNILGAQNMWVPKGNTQRILLNNFYSQKDAKEMVISNETSLAYIELWTKEHKSDIREVPVADIFVTVYFWRLRQNGLDKKALQLENINGIANDVQYCVLKSFSKIIVSWHSGHGNEKKTKIRSYHLAADFQTVAIISEIQPVEHCVTSLHNIEDCDNLIMGFGENKITLWNIEYGYIVATIELANVKLPISTLWVKCDRGFLFLVQECLDQELRLIAINGMNHSWKKLQTYMPATEFDKLKGVYLENGVLLAYYQQGNLCWNAQTGELMIEEIHNEFEYIPSGKHVIILSHEKMILKHALSHLITCEDL